MRFTVPLALSGRPRDSALATTFGYQTALVTARVRPPRIGRIGPRSAHFLRFSEAGGTRRLGPAAEQGGNARRASEAAPHPEHRLRSQVGGRAERSRAR